MDENSDRRNNFVVLDMDEDGRFVPSYYSEWHYDGENVTLVRHPREKFR